MRRIIKKYKNRKLYDTEESKYISLPTIAEMIGMGIEVVVIDQQTRVDVTGPTLAQAILSDEKQLFLPVVVEKLREILHVGGIYEYSKDN